MVIANAVGALLEIRETSSKKDVFALNSVVLNKMLAALNECTEWGQISIMEALASYTPADHREAELVAERVLPRLQHANVSVVLCAIKVIFLYLEHVKNEETFAMLVRKLGPPLGKLFPHSVSKQD